MCGSVNINFIVNLFNYMEHSYHVGATIAISGGASGEDKRLASAPQAVPS